MQNEDLKRYGTYFAPGMHTELRIQKNTSRRVTMVSGNLAVNDRQDISGISARVYKNGVYGFSSMAEQSEEAAKTVLRAATDNAEFMDRHIQKGKPPIPAISDAAIAEPEEIVDVPQKQYIEVLREIDGYITKKYPGLASRTVVASADCMDKKIITSDGCCARSVLPRSYVYVVFTALTDRGTPVELFKALGKNGTFDRNFSDLSAHFETIDRLYESIMKKREGVYAQAGLKTCILGGELTGMLAHEAVGHTVEADLVLGGSVAAHCMNNKVASEIVSLTDFAHTAFGEVVPLPIFVDDEGVKAIDAPLIRDGILVGYMNNRETAQHFSMQPTGNARAYLFSDEPLIRMRNTAIHPGKSKLEDMISSVEDGYYLVDTNNGQADTTGEFMFGVSMGYEIKNGKLGKAILDTTISGVAFEMLKTVDMVSDEVSWVSSGFCGKKQPMPVGLGGPALKCKIMIGGR